MSFDEEIVEDEEEEVKEEKYKENAIDKLLKLKENKLTQKGKKIVELIYQIVTFRW